MHEANQEVTEQPYVFDLNGCQPSYSVLAHIATLLETHGSVLVRNSYRAMTPGAATMHFSAHMQKALEALEREESRKT